jgi:hypothetical protein
MLYTLTGDDDDDDDDEVDEDDRNDDEDGLNEMPPTRLPVIPDVLEVVNGFGFTDPELGPLRPMLEERPAAGVTLRNEGRE